jgi:SAM-dependent methyltransferase
VSDSVPHNDEPPSGSPHGGDTPSPWVVRFAPLIGGPALDLACGGGRHVRWLRRRGIAVTAVDRDVSGLTDLAGDPGTEIVAADFEAAEAGWPAKVTGGDRTFATVIVTNYLWRPLLPSIVAAVAPGGTLVYETFARGNAAFGKPSNPDFLLAPGELLDAVHGELQIVAYEHGIVDTPRPAVVQRLCAVRRDEPVATGT